MDVDRGWWIYRLFWGIVAQYTDIEHFSIYLTLSLTDFFFFWYVYVVIMYYVCSVYNVKSGTWHRQTSLFFILFIEVGPHSEPRAHLLPSLTSQLVSEFLSLPSKPGRVEVTHVWSFCHLAIMWVLRRQFFHWAFS